MSSRLTKGLEILFVVSLVYVCLPCWHPALAQGISLPPAGSAHLTTANETFTEAPAIRLAQVSPPPGTIPTDITPVDVGQARDYLTDSWRVRLFQRLPAKLWFNSTTEVSQRLDTNVFFTFNKPRADYTFRALPNVTLGWSVLNNSSIYCNYFVIKDVFAKHGHLLTFPTTQSLALGLRQDLTLSRKTFLQLDFQSRELWQTAGLRQSDLLPAVNVTRVVTPNAILFGSVLLQMRGKFYFQGPAREIDPFYSIGSLFRRGSWNFVATDTLVTNFRHDHSVPRQGNVSMIADFEVSRPLFKNRPGLVAFLRAEPIWNWSSHKAPGISGFDFRLFGGLRLAINKPSYAAQVSQLKRQLLESEEEEKKQKKPGAAPSGSNSGNKPEPAPTAPPAPAEGTSGNQ